MCYMYPDIRQYTYHLSWLQKTDGVSPHLERSATALPPGPRPTPGGVVGQAIGEHQPDLVGEGLNVPGEPVQGIQRMPYAKNEHRAILIEKTQLPSSRREDKQ